MHLRSSATGGHTIMRRLFCFGLGYTTTALARALLADGWQVAGTTRSPDKRDRLAAEGIETHLFGRDQPFADPAAVLAGTTHLLTSIAPDEDGDPVLDVHGAMIEELGGLDWVGYLSTTAVYGNRDGGWVDETSDRLPTSERGRRRVTAEDRWLALAAPVHVFRLAGIYGPGRSPLDSVRAGRARRIVKPGHAFSRIHRDDIVRVLRASMDQPRGGAVYNVCDDLPAPSAEPIEYACQLLGVTPPPEEPFETAEMTPMARSFWGDNKKTDNGRVKAELGIRLRYPDYRAGLDAIARGEGACS